MKLHEITSSTVRPFEATLFVKSPVCPCCMGLPLSAVMEMTWPRLEQEATDERLIKMVFNKIDR